MKHKWNVTPKEAIAIQNYLSDKIILNPLNNNEINLVGGADISFNRKSKTVYAGIIVLNYKSFEIVEQVTSISEVNFPYIPGLLSFREVPPLIKCWESLKTKPDVLLLDGHGIAHPRRFGLACHFGLYFDIPTIGCAKNRLIGEFQEPGINIRTYSALMENYEHLGYVYRSKSNVKPIFISPGHLTDQWSSLIIAENTIDRYRIPEPTRQAHLLVNKLRKNSI